MELIQSNIDFLWYSFNNIVQQALMSTVTYWATIASQTTSSTRQEVHAWIDRLPLMREWLGERQILNLQTRAYTLINKDYEATVEIDRNPLLDDQFGIFNARAQALGMSGALWPDQLVINALQNGDTTAATCYDGQPYFNGSHPLDPDQAGSATQSNLFNTASGDARPLTSANFAYVRAKMLAWKGANNFPVNTIPDTIYVPPLLDVTARQIVNSAFTAPAVAVGQNAASTVQSNVLNQLGFSVVMIPKLAGDDATWYMGDTKTLGAIVRGIIFQIRQPVTIVQKTSPTDDNVFKTRKFLWGIDSRGNAGYTLPFLLAKAST